jgi:hypothetical protein
MIGSNNIKVSHTEYTAQMLKILLKLLQWGFGWSHLTKQMINQLQKK